MIMSAAQNGIQKVIVPRSNLKEAKLVRNIEVYGFDKLPDVIRFLEGKSTGDIMNQREETQTDVFREYALDFADVKGQNDLIEAVVLAAAGGHNMLMIGEPGCGKTMLAERIPTILPKMTEEESLEVTKIYSISGMVKDGNTLVTNRPFRAPHHNASLNALIGILAMMFRWMQKY